MQSTDPGYNIPPFPAFPATSRYVPLGSVQETLARVCRSIDAREAISLVVGPPGTGKSLICGLLQQHYQASHEVVVLGETAIDDSPSFLRRLLHQLKVDLTDIHDNDLQLALVQRVCDQPGAEAGLLLIVDEAQSLSPAVLESIRMVTNITREGEPRVFAVLCGGVKLDETLVEASLEPFTQRVATRCYLHPMNGEETRRYITETIQNCGAEPAETITEGAVAAIHHACCGVPRLVNQMVTQAVDCAEEMGQSLITEQLVDKAWAELQQLPSPMVEEPKLAKKANPIEFGELDDSVSFGRLTTTEESDGANAGDDTTAESTGPCDLEHSDVEQCDLQRCDLPEGSASEDALDDSSDTADCPPGNLDVQVENGEWLDETTSEPIPSPSADELFGQFEEEEEISVGSGVQRSSTDKSMPPADLEAMLHQEIVGLDCLGCDVDGDQATMSPRVVMAAPADTRDTVDTEEFVEETEQERVDEFVVVEEEEVESADSDRPELTTVSFDFDDEEQAASGADDSDILVIEDELELRHCDGTTTRVDAKDKTISVDFQAMLTRMRSGS